MTHTMISLFNIKTFLKSKGFIHKGEKISTNYPWLNLLESSDGKHSFFAALSINYHTFKILIGSSANELDYSEDWMNYLLETYPTQETASKILNEIKEEKEQIKQDSDKKIKELKAVISSSCKGLSRLGDKENFIQAKIMQAENEGE